MVKRYIINKLIHSSTLQTSIHITFEHCVLRNFYLLLICYWSLVVNIIRRKHFQSYEITKLIYQKYTDKLIDLTKVYL